MLAQGEGVSRPLDTEKGGLTPRFTAAVSWQTWRLKGVRAVCCLTGGLSACASLANDWKKMIFFFLKKNSKAFVVRLRFVMYSRNR